MAPSRIENKAPRRRRQLTPATIVLLSLLAPFVIACGNKGPLYLPTGPEIRETSGATQESERSAVPEPEEQRQEPAADDEEEEKEDGGR